MPRSGPQLALLSAALFGISPTLIKALLGQVPPLLVAGMLYLGSGLGLLVFLLAQKSAIKEQLKALSPAHRLKLAGAVVSGGILAPVALTYGIRSGTAFEVSLLLNLETVATTLIAAFVFHEHVSRHVWIGKALIVAGAILMSLELAGGVSLSISSLLVVGACVLWGADNNLTRDIEELSPALLSSVKGFAAGIFNVALAVIFAQTALTLPQAGAMLAIGAVSYGLSLVLFVKALRLIGSARTSSYFAAGPFVGMAAAVALLGDRPAPYQWCAAALMLAGVWTLYRERHAHPHTHERVTHSHLHTHDEHHQHRHSGIEGPEPHEHAHTHEALTHSHAHLPDIHHRHRH